MEIIIILTALTFIFWIGFHISGALLSATVWLLVKLPIAAVVFSIGWMCCITLFLLPLGLKCFKFSAKMLF